MATIMRYAKQEPQFSRRKFCIGTAAAILVEACAGVQKRKTTDVEIKSQMARFKKAAENLKVRIARANSFSEISDMLREFCHSLHDIENKYTRLTKVESTFQELEGSLNLNPKIWMSIWALRETADVLNKSDFAVEQLQLRKRSSLQILYPGVGEHSFPPLELGLMLQRVFPNIKEVRLIYTDLYYDGSEGQAHLFFERSIRKLFYPHVRIISKRIRELKSDLPRADSFGCVKGKGLEAVYQLNVFGKTMEVVFALSLVSKDDHSHFKKQYAVSSDIIMFHGELQPIPTSLGISAWSGKPQAFIFSWVYRSENPSPSQHTPGRMLTLTRPYGYGNRGFIYLPDHDKIKAMVRESGGIKKFLDSRDDFHNQWDIVK